MPRRAGRHGQDEPQRRGRRTSRAPTSSAAPRSRSPAGAAHKRAHSHARTHSRGRWRGAADGKARSASQPTASARPHCRCLCVGNDRRTSACARSRARACTHTCRRSASKRGCKRCGRTGASVHLLHVVHCTCDAACDVGRMPHSAQRTQVRDHSQGLREGLQDQREEVGQRLRVLPLSCRAAFGRACQRVLKRVPNGPGHALGGSMRARTGMRGGPAWIGSHQPMARCCA